MKTWNQIAKELHLDHKSETQVHPHVPIERAELFRCRDNSGCTEWEFLNLLNALTVAFKPSIAIETGTFTGFGTIAIALGMRANGFGKLVTIDIDECKPARKLIQDYKCSQHVDFIQKDAEVWCSEYNGSPAQLAFVDSGGGRLREANLLIDRKIVENGVIMVHDASPHRLTSNGDPTWHELFTKACSRKGYTLPLSRGLHIIFVD